MDFKGWWHDREGRCEPLTVRDEYSRYVLELRALPNARTATVQACFERLFAEHGLPEAIRSDNGVPFASPNGLLGLSRLSVWWLAIGLDLERSRPGCRRTMVATSACTATSPENSKASSMRNAKPLLKLGAESSMKSDRIRPSECECPQSSTNPPCARGKEPLSRSAIRAWPRRRVKTAGAICYEHRRIFISQALAGWDVGLRYHSEERMEVYFAQLLLGVLEMPTAAFIPLTELQPATKSMLAQQGKELQMLAAA